MLLPGYVTDSIGILCFARVSVYYRYCAVIAPAYHQHQNMFGSRFANGFSSTADKGFDNKNDTYRHWKTLDGISSKAILKKKINNSLSKGALGCRMLAANP